MKIDLSFCLYNNGTFDVIVVDESGTEVVLSGEHEWSQESMHILVDIAPPCVYTTYERVDEIT